MHSSIANSDCIRLNLKFTMSLSLTVNPVNCACPLPGVSGHRYLPCRNRSHIYRWYPLDTYFLLWLCSFQPNTDFLSGNRRSTVVGQSWQRKAQRRKALLKCLDCNCGPTATMCGLAALPTSAVTELSELCFQVSINLIRRRN